MYTLKKLYRIGMGPSSSHTMAPKKAAEIFGAENSNADSFLVTLYGSLAATGRGHMTDKAIEQGFAPKNVDIAWKPKIVLPMHPNGMLLEALDSKGKVIASKKAYSTGGGGLKWPTEEDAPHIYEMTTMREILTWADQEGRSLWEYVYSTEPDIETYLTTVWDCMKKCIETGLDNEGVLPGGLNVPRKATSYFTKTRNTSGFIKHIGTAFAYALAVSEENAAGGTVVTAPTCGASGVLPAVLKVLQETYEISDKRIYRALATAGIIGNIVKHNGSISGAEVGCQGEIGTACAMAAGAAAQLLGGSPHQVEYAAEMGLEHHLGLTCDPVNGLVQIPCIERNAIAATRALDCAAYALLSDGKHKITFNAIIKTMVQTGKDMHSTYRETSAGGLAKYHTYE